MFAYAVMNCNKKNFFQNREVMRVLIELLGRHRVWARRNTSHDYNSEVEWPPSSPDLSCWSVFGCGVSILKNILQTSA